MSVNRNQFQISHICVATFTVAVLLALFVVWRTLAILLNVSFVPASLVVLAYCWLRQSRFNYIGAAWLVLLSFSFFCIYFLSIGPIIYFQDSLDVLMPYISAFYQPLEYLNTPANPMQGAMDWYIVQWEQAAGITRSVCLLYTSPSPRDS